MHSCLFSIIYLKLIVGQESYAEMQKNNFLKPKVVKKKTETIKSRNGSLIYKKILKPVKPNLMKKANKLLMKKIGGKTMRSKTQSLNLWRNQQLNPFWIFNEHYSFLKSLRRKSKLKIDKIKMSIKINSLLLCH